MPLQSEPNASARKFPSLLVCAKSHRGGGCEPPTCVITMGYDSATVWVDDLNLDRHPASILLCVNCIAGFTVPLGWTLVDRRSDNSVLQEDSSDDLLDATSLDAATAASRAGDSSTFSPASLLEANEMAGDASVFPTRAKRREIPEGDAERRPLRSEEQGCSEKGEVDFSVVSSADNTTGPDLASDLSGTRHVGSETSSTEKDSGREDGLPRAASSRKKPFERGARFQHRSQQTEEHAGQREKKGPRKDPAAKDQGEDQPRGSGSGALHGEKNDGDETRDRPLSPEECFLLFTDAPFEGDLTEEISRRRLP